MPEIAQFKLERYFARYEFKAPYILSASDCESFLVNELVELADENSRKLWEGLSLGYTESAGHPALRQEITRFYPTLTPEHVLVLAPEEGIFIAMQTLLLPGDEVIVLSPAYQSLLEVARSLNFRVAPWELQAASDRWLLDFDLLEQILTPHTRMLVINFPHNPTGFLPSLDELEKIIEIARNRNLILFSDEMYRLLEYDAKTRLPSVCDLYENGITLSGMSKVFGLPGLRIGWLATRSKDLLSRCSTYKDYTTICNSAPGEVLALIGLRAQETILARNYAIVRKNLALAEKFFGGSGRPFHWMAPLGGSVAFPGWRGPGSVEALCQGLVEQAGVMVTPGRLFDYPGEHFRIGLGRRSFSDALEQVGSYLDLK